ncbi:signal recognition particle, SRP9/SRP14 subunit [Schizopora paradoxa]|uniref:Signal recognition particle, SRP9/SRP14 subunit n=1 Tax=Schizopora paradoxa TaxID=27342 RepID=A0A0H2SHF5_9AGAM|nr:signal recognition particle, SRP9/SRP14 subunit [Schizopora paradoxa]
MVYVHSWTEYQRQAEELYQKSPNKVGQQRSLEVQVLPSSEARYCVKWKASEGKLVLKITDDTTCLKYKTHSSIFLNRFEALNLSLMEKMTNRRPPPVIIATPTPIRSGTPNKLGVKMEVDEQSRSGTPVNAGAGASAVKKKRPNKKKK